MALLSLRYHNQEIWLYTIRLYQSQYKSIDHDLAFWQMQADLERNSRHYMFSDNLSFAINTLVR